MNHLTNIIQFYKSLKNDDKKAVEAFIDKTDSTYFEKWTKRVKIKNLELVFFSLLDEKEMNCIYCFQTIYQHNFIFIPLSLHSHYFYLKPAKKQLLTNHIEVIDISHDDDFIGYDIFNYFKEFLQQFPSYLIIYSKHEHFYFEAGLIEGELLSQDASHFINETYLVDWYTTVFLIKDNDLEIIKKEYHKLINKYKEYKFDIILFFRGKYYLYLIVNTTTSNILPIEALGIIKSSANPNKVLNTYNEVIEKLKTGKII